MDETKHVRLVSTRNFLDGIMPVDSGILQQIYDAVMGHRDKLYADKRWQKFPKAEKHYQELDFYPAFIKTANVIAKEARALAGVRDDQVREAAWVDYHSRAPQHLEESATKIRPDCALAMDFAENVLKEGSEQVSNSYSIMEQLLRTCSRKKTTVYFGYSSWLWWRPSATTNRRIKTSLSSF